MVLICKTQAGFQLAQNVKPDLSIIIPAYREELRIGRTLEELFKFLVSNELMSTLDVEVIVVSADSDDRTDEVVESFISKHDNLRLLRLGTRAGKGRDVRVGMLAAKGNAVIFMDADLATPLSHIPEFHEMVAKGSGVVIATRNLRTHHPEITRMIFSVVGNALYRILCGAWIEDSQCGFKMFSERAAKICFDRATIDGWGFDMEILTIARINNLQCKSVKIYDWSSVPGGSFDDSVIKNYIRSFFDLCYIAQGRVVGRYKSKQQSSAKL